MAAAPPPPRRRRRPAGTASPRRSRRGRRGHLRRRAPHRGRPPTPRSGGGRPRPRPRVRQRPQRRHPGPAGRQGDRGRPERRLLARARERAERAEVRVELHQGGLAELAFLRSDSVDAALSVMALASVDDVDRVFRQVHRVLKPQAPFVCSFPHPAFAMFDPTAADPLRGPPLRPVRPLTWDLGPDVVTDHPRTVGELFTALNRASFLVDQLLEPTAPARGSRSGGFADAMTSVPATLVLRGRKQGN
ncbi:MAG: methyltransferase domain-containing protein [Acidimicrobiales bacterium]